MADKPPCPACHRTEAVGTIKNLNFFLARCSVAMGGCGECSGHATTEATALAIWARTAEERAKLLAKIPVLSEELPDKEGLWWWKEEQYLSTVLLSLSNTGLGDLWACHHTGELLPKEHPHEMGGLWAKVIPPEQPKGEGS